MRSRIARGTLLICLSLCLAGCSTMKRTGEKSSWWPPSFKSKKSADTAAIASNAPSAPAYGATAAPTVTMPGGGYPASAPNYYGGTQYPVTPYPSPAAPAYTAAAPAASNGYMPPTNPYAAAPANPYATAAPSNPYGATAGPADPYAQANPYAQTGTYSTTPNQGGAAYTAGGQNVASPYPGAPTGGTEYTR